ncbi:hypothetical protein FB451DRAFT_314278 [Mycena latifolia]|nr:hypothetical protein FB451DRAFT_314278 [Mycena latifolia]
MYRPTNSAILTGQSSYPSPDRPQIFCITSQRTIRLHGPTGSITSPNFCRARNNRENCTQRRSTKDATSSSSFPPSGCAAAVIAIPLDSKWRARCPVFHQPEPPSSRRKESRHVQDLPRESLLRQCLPTAWKPDSILWVPNHGPDVRRRFQVRVLSPLCRTRSLSRMLATFDEAAPRRAHARLDPLRLPNDRKGGRADARHLYIRIVRYGFDYGASGLHVI